MPGPVHLLGGRDITLPEQQEVKANQPEIREMSQNIVPPGLIAEGLLVDEHAVSPNVAHDPIGLGYPMANMVVVEVDVLLEDHPLK